MRKEVIVAILSGSALGLIIAFGVWRANQAFKSNIQVETTQEDKQEVKNPTNQFNLTIASPENNAISTTSTVTITGITRPNTYLVASNADSDEIVKSDEKGSFSIDVSLDDGINPIKITSLDPTNGSAQENITIIYSSEFKKFMSSESDTKEATSEADTIRERVKEKLAEAQNKPLTYIGTITDLTEKTIQLRDDSGEILQVALSADTEYTKTTGTVKKAEFKDLAIGDYIASLGFKENGDVLSGKRIILTTKPEDIQETSLFGQVTKIARTELTLKDNSAKEWTAKFGKTWDGPNLTTIDEEDRVIVVGTQADSTLSSTRTLYVTKETE